MYPHLHHFQHTAASGGFFETFSAELLAGLVVAVLAATLIPAYLDWRKKPRLQFKNRGNRSDVCPLNRAGDGTWLGTFQLVVRNDGSHTTREWYWHILVPSDLNPTLRGHEAPAGEPLVGSGRSWVHFYGKRPDPIYPKSGWIFPYELSLRTAPGEFRGDEVYYYFSTEYGTSPVGAQKFAKIVEAMGRSADNAFKPEYLSKLIIQPTP